MNQENPQTVFNSTSAIEQLAQPLRDLRQQTHEIENHPCVEFEDALEDSGLLDENRTPCSQTDERFGTPQLRKRCLQCYAAETFGITITAESNEITASIVRQTVGAFERVKEALSVRINELCGMTVSDDILQILFFDNIMIDLVPGEGLASSTTANNSLTIELPMGLVTNLSDNTYINLDWLILHELSHGFHNRLGLCNDENPLLSANLCEEGIIVHTEGNRARPILLPRGMPIVVAEFLETTGGYWNTTGERDYGDWLRDGGYIHTDDGVIPLTSLNDINGNRIETWYENNRLNGNQRCQQDFIENQGTSEEFVYVNRSSQCVRRENAGFYRPVDGYTPFFELQPGTNPTNIQRLMPNATGRTNHASPKEDFADSLAHYILGGADRLQTIGLRDDDPRVTFLEDNFCAWISELINSRQ